MYMNKKRSHSNNTRLYVTEDIYSDAYFIRTDVEKFARMVFRNSEWFVWYYPLKYNQRFKTLTETLEITERLFKKYWREKYEIHNC